ncbi:hypothetical protein D1007_38524 [Hordeum vulgare]|nr:hypothetical protein D1007_38524 [Hordeum vulgare]
MWSISRPNDPMRLHPGCLPSDTLNGVLQVLLSKSVGGLPCGGLPLYKYKNGGDFAWRCLALSSKGCFPEAMRGHETRLSW